MARTTTIIEAPYRVVRQRLSNHEVDTAVRQHVSTLPKWLQELEVDWLYKEIADRRMKAD